MPEKRNRGKAFLIITIIFLVIITICIFFGILSTIPTKTAESFGPSDPDLPIFKSLTQSVVMIVFEDELKKTGDAEGIDLVFPIKEGDSLDRILGGLQHLGLVEHPSAVRAYLIYSGIDTRIQPGEYLFSTGMSELDIAKGLGDPSSLRVNLVILAGWRVEEIADSFADLGLNIPSGDFINLVKTNNKEGYLFPGSYAVERGISAEELIEVFYQGFLSNFPSELEGRINDQGLTLQEVVILASIIEREAILEEEMPLIASVFSNRLMSGLNLAADPTVQYALGYTAEQDTWWKNPLQLSDLEVPSPYNTYENPGLPPGPICNPSLAALEAAASPADTTYFYFRAACDNSGSHLFAETFDEHLNHACPE
jgi:UPF0755 protein